MGPVILPTMRAPIGACVLCKQVGEIVKFDEFRKELEVDDNTVTLYTDGSYTRDNAGRRYAAIGVYNQHSKTAEAYEVTKRTMDIPNVSVTNNAAEMLAIRTAIEHIELHYRQSSRKRVIYSDSMYLV